MKDKKIRGTESIPFELKDLLDDEMDQIPISDTLFEVFDLSSKLKNNYNRKKSWKLFNHVVRIYNDTFDDTKFRCFNFS